MKVRGDSAPPSAFTLEFVPKRPGKALARFYENPEQFESEEDGVTVRGWMWDEYHLELTDCSGLECDIAANFEDYIAQAKLLEAESKIIPDLQDKVSTLEAEKSELESSIVDNQLALVEVYEMIAGGDE